jgi:hypothetical protein
MSDELLATYRTKFEVPAEDELTGAAHDPPPEGFATWRAWAAERWPSAVDQSQAEVEAEKLRGSS